eukprot:gene9434-12713_t
MSLHLTTIKSISTNDSLDTLLANVRKSRIQKQDQKLSIYRSICDIRADCATIKGHNIKLTRVFVNVQDSESYSNVGWVLANEISNCMVCYASFGMFGVKHHCRACGTVICGDCGLLKVPISGLLKHGRMRVCKTCFSGQALVHLKKNRNLGIHVSSGLRSNTESKSIPTSLPVDIDLTIENDNDTVSEHSEKSDHSTASQSSDTGSFTPSGSSTAAVVFDLDENSVKNVQDGEPENIDLIPTLPFKQLSIANMNQFQNRKTINHDDNAVIDDDMTIEENDNMTTVHRMRSPRTVGGGEDNISVFSENTTPMFKSFHAPNMNSTVAKFKLPSPTTSAKNEANNFHVTNNNQNSKTDNEDKLLQRNIELEELVNKLQMQNLKLTQQLDDTENAACRNQNKNDELQNEIVKITLQFTQNEELYNQNIEEINVLNNDILNYRNKIDELELCLQNNNKDISTQQVKINELETLIKKLQSENMKINQHLTDSIKVGCRSQEQKENIRLKLSYFQQKFEEKSMLSEELWMKLMLTKNELNQNSSQNQHKIDELISKIHDLECESIESKAKLSHHITATSAAFSIFSQAKQVTSSITHTQQQPYNSTAINTQTSHTHSFSNNKSTIFNFPNSKNSSFSQANSTPFSSFPIQIPTTNTTLIQSNLLLQPSTIMNISPIDTISSDHNQLLPTSGSTTTGCLSRSNEFKFDTSKLFNLRCRSTSSDGSENIYSSLGMTKMQIDGSRLVTTPVPCEMSIEWPYNPRNSINNICVNSSQYDNTKSQDYKANLQTNNTIHEEAVEIDTTSSLNSVQTSNVPLNTIQVYSPVLGYSEDFDVIVVSDELVQFNLGVNESSKNMENKQQSSEECRDDSTLSSDNDSSHSMTSNNTVTENNHDEIQIEEDQAIQVEECNTHDRREDSVMITSDMMSMNPTESLSELEQMKLLEQSISDPRILLGWQILLVPDHDRSSLCCYPSGIYIIMDIRNTIFSIAEYRLSRIGNDDIWVALRRNDMDENTIPFTPLRKALNFNDIDQSHFQPIFNEHKKSVENNRNSVHFSDHNPLHNHNINLKNTPKNQYKSTEKSSVNLSTMDDRLSPHSTCSQCSQCTINQVVSKDLRKVLHEIQQKYEKLSVVVSSWQVEREELQSKVVVLSENVEKTTHSNSNVIKELEETKNKLAQAHIALMLKEKQTKELSAKVDLLEENLINNQQNKMSKMFWSSTTSGNK